MAARRSQSALRVLSKPVLPFERPPRISLPCATQCGGRKLPPQRRWASTKATHAVSVNAWGDMRLGGLTIRELEQAKKLDPELRYDPDQYLATLQMFEQMAPNYGANWALKIKEDVRPTKELLNDLAWMIIHNSWDMEGPKQRVVGPWVHAMFAGAAELGCRASCISLARMLIESKSTGITLFKPVMARYRNIILEGMDPNAFSLEAKHLVMQEKYNTAGRFAQRALDISGGEGFEFEGDAHYALGVVYEKAGKKAQALEQFHKAADAGVSVALSHLAELSEDLKEKQQCLYNLGCMGIGPGFHKLGEVKLFLGEHPLLPPAAREEHRRMALEWMRLGSADAKY